MSDYLRGLERMANQIARNFAAGSPEETVASVAGHLERFWDPSMRRDLAEAAAAGRVEVTAEVRAALGRLSRE